MNDKQKMIYSKPEVRVVEVTPERGFATSNYHMQGQALEDFILFQSEEDNTRISRFGTDSWGGYEWND